jgi:hypothetical protein
MAPEKKPSHKPPVSEDQMIRSMITSFSIEGIKLTIEEAQELLRKAKLNVRKPDLHLKHSH